LARQQGAFVACFPLDVLMVQLPEPTIVTNGKNLTGAKFT
jgi:hypothetical protein